MNRRDRRREKRQHRRKSKYAQIKAQLPGLGYYTNRARIVWLANRPSRGQFTTTGREALITDWRNMTTSVHQGPA